MSPKEFASFLFSTHAAVSEEDFDPESKEKINYNFINHAIMSLRHVEMIEERYHHLRSQNPITKETKHPFKKTLTHKFLEETNKELESLKLEANGNI